MSFFGKTKTPTIEEIQERTNKAKKELDDYEEQKKIDRNNYLEGIFQEMSQDFRNYGGGYRYTSTRKIKNYEDFQRFSKRLPDTEAISYLTNKISQVYGCKLHSFSRSENLAEGPIYIFCFEK